MHTPGTILENNRYAIQELLGEGGFGRVYRAVDQRLQQDVAIKETTEDSTEFARQFAFEAQVLAGLSHPALPVVSNYFSESNRSYLVMSYVPGETLKDYLARQPGQRIDEAEAIRLVEPIVAALEYLHGRPRPIIHRDIKPGNVRITPEGQVFLVDFGLAKAFDPDQRTTMGARAITPGYSPLEQYGVGITDARSDLYALGATLYHMVTGMVPPQAIQRTSTDPLMPPRQINQTLSPAFEALILRLMAIDPNQRVQSAAELAQMLKDLQRPSYCTSCGTPNKPTSQFCVNCGARMHASVGAPDTGIPSTAPAPNQYVMPGGPPQTANPANLGSYPSAQPGQTPPAASYPPTVAPTKARRNPLIWIGMILVALVVVGGGAIWGLVQFVLPTIMPGPNGPTVVTERATITPASEDTNAQALATVAALTDSRFRLYGPVPGSITHEENGRIESEYANVAVQDFLAEAFFSNPYDAGEQDWDYGFMFRHTGTDREYRLVIDSEQIWKLILRDGSDSDEIARGPIANLRTGAGDTNFVRLVAEGSRAYLFVNDVFISELDVAEKLTAGDVAIATGIFTDHEREGAVTGYRDFSVLAIGIDASIAERNATEAAITQATTVVRERTATAVAAATATAEAEAAAGAGMNLETLLARFSPFFGPIDGEIPHEDDTYIETFYIELEGEPVQLRDFVADVRFTNPYAADEKDWDYGFIFRENNNAEYHLVLRSQRSWVLLHRPAGEESSTVDSGALSSLNIGDGESNTLRLVASGSRGFLLVNDELISELDLSQNNEAGEIAAATGLYSDTEIEGRVTPFSELRIQQPVDDSEWPIAFSDSFDSNANEWPVGQYEDELAVTVKDVRDGSYAWRIDSLQALISRSTFAFDLRDNFALSTEARLVSGGPTDTAYGLIFRYDRNDDDIPTYYIFRIAEDGTYQVRLYDGTQFVNITEWESTDAVRPGENNRITVIGNGSAYRFLVNDQQVFEVVDETLSGGSFGVAASVFAEDTVAEFAFDSVELRQPE
jgi:serine/threonine protein kinase